VKCEWTILTLKEHFTVLLKERDDRYMALFKESKEAVAAALAAQKELTNAAFASSEKAIVKAEESQTVYNTGHNDLTRKMEGQYKEMIPRAEHEEVIKALENKISQVQTTQSKTEGKGLGAASVIAYIFGAAGFLAALVLLISYLSKK
jgi:hypothetical protein